MSQAAVGVFEGAREGGRSTSGAEPVWLPRFARFLVFSVLFLIFVGALVTSNYAGLSVPDWPTTFGQNMFLYPFHEWKGGIFYEHSHRLVASGIGAMTLVLAIWVWFADSRRTIRLLALGCLFAVCLQGTLGGLTVILKLPAVVSASHGVLAQSFLMLLVVLAYLLSREGRALSTPGAAFASDRIFKAGVQLCGAVYLQLVVAAFMRHTYSGIAIPDFPTMGGSWLPIPTTDMVERANALREAIGLAPIQRYQVVLHLVHRLGALIVGAALVQAIVTYRSSGSTIGEGMKRRLGNVLAIASALYFFQFALGVFTVWSVRNAVVTSLHVLFGASLLATSMFFVVRAARAATGVPLRETPRSHPAS